MQWNDRWKNRWIVGGMVAAVIAMPTSTDAAEQPMHWVDVPTQYEDAVRYVVSKGVEGRNETQFGVYDPLTRIEAAQFIARLLQLDIPTETTVSFKDVPREAAPYIQALYDANVMTGVNEEEFGAAYPLTRGHVALIVHRVYALHADGELDVPFSDVPTLYEEAVRALVAHGITKGKTNATFGTGDPVTRGQLALFFHRLQEKEPFPEVVRPIVVESSKRLALQLDESLGRDWAREMEKSGRYVLVYPVGTPPASARSIQSSFMTFNDTYDHVTVQLSAPLQAGVTYVVSIMDGPDRTLAEPLYTFEPELLRPSAKHDGVTIDVEAHTLHVHFSEEMKKSALQQDAYTLYDAGGRALGPLTEFIEGAPRWKDLNTKRDVIFTLKKQSLRANTAYRLHVAPTVETASETYLANEDAIIRFTTPDVPLVKATVQTAWFENGRTLHVLFDRPIGADALQHVPSYDIRTASGKSVDLSGMHVSTRADSRYVLTLTFPTDRFDVDQAYRMSLPNGLVTHRHYVNVVHDGVEQLRVAPVQVQRMTSLKATFIKRVRDVGKADLLLTFDERPHLDEAFIRSMRLFDHRDEYRFAGTLRDVDYYGGDPSGKTIVVRDVDQFQAHYKSDGGELGTPFILHGNRTYSVEFDANTLTAAAKQTPRYNTKLVAETTGISVKPPRMKSVSVSKGEARFTFHEPIKGHIHAGHIQLNAFERKAKEPKLVQGSGYFSTEIVGNQLIVKAEKDVEFATGQHVGYLIREDVVTNESGELGNARLYKEAAPFPVEVKTGTVAQTMPLLFRTTYDAYRSSDTFTIPTRE